MSDPYCLLEPSLHPCEVPHSSEVGPLGVACCIQSQPSSPGRTTASPSPKRWHLMWESSFWERWMKRSIFANKILKKIFIDVFKLPSASNHLWRNLLRLESSFLFYGLKYYTKTQSKRICLKELTFPCFRAYFCKTCPVLWIISGWRILKLSGLSGISSTTSLQNHILDQKLCLKRRERC